MSKVYSVLVTLLVVGIVGGLVFLATWDIPPPLHPVDKDVTANALNSPNQPVAAPGQHIGPR